MSIYLLNKRNVFYCSFSFVFSILCLKRYGFIKQALTVFWEISIQYIHFIYEFMLVIFIKINPYYHSLRNKNTQKMDVFPYVSIYFIF